jgi:putative heme-binding domain-containing protein
MLDALRRAATERKLRPGGDLTPLVGLLTASDVDLRIAALRLAGAWRLEQAREWITSSAGADAPAVRTAALQALVDLGADSGAVLIRLAASGQTARRVEAAAALARLDMTAAAPIVASLLSAATDMDASALVAPFLAQQAGPSTLAGALAGRSLQPASGRAMLRAISSSGLNLPELTAAVETAAGLGRVVAMPARESLDAMMRAVDDDGDAARGEEVYRRTQLLCTSCHAIAGAGGRVGPDLTSIGGSAPVDYLIESLLDPGARVKEGYEVVTVGLRDGTIAAGMIVRDGGADIMLRDGSDTVITIPTAEVVSRAVRASSLMPPGLTAQLRRDELVDLVKFLSVLGRDARYTVPRARVLRRWRILEADRDLSAMLREQGMGLAARAPASLVWRAAYSTVAGDLPLAEVPVVSYFGAQRFRVVAFDIDVLRPGASSMRVSAGQGLSIWVDGQPVDLNGLVIAANLTAGRHVVTVAVDANVYTDEFLRIDVADGTAATAEMDFVSGK